VIAAGKQSRAKAVDQLKNQADALEKFYSQTQKKQEQVQPATYGLVLCFVCEKYGKRVCG
jgi:hypothetical protein